MSSTTYRECSNCIFFERDQDAESPVWNCRRYPPEFNKEFNRPMYRETYPVWWCGEWQKHPKAKVALLGLYPNLTELSEPKTRTLDVDGLRVTINLPH